MVTVPSLVDETPLDQYTATASQTDFNFTYMIFATEDIKVYVNDVLKTETTDYVVKQSDGSAIVPADDLPMDGGKVVFNSGLTSGDKVSLSRDIAIERLTGYSVAGAFRADVVNAEFTKIFAVQQQLERDLARTVRLSASDAEGGSLTLPSNRASQFLAFDANGDMIASAGSADSITVSTFMATVLDDTTAAAALTTLGISSYAQTLLDDANAAAALTTLGISSYAQTLLDDANAAAARTTLDTEQKINSLSAITTMQDTDEIAIADASDSNNSKKVTNANFGRRLKSIQTFTSSGTWTKPAGINAVLVRLVGGGGSGGATTAVNSAGGAGGGGFAESYMNASDLGATETVTVGSGGAGVSSSSSGNSGGSTSFGSHLSATGGAGGGVGSGFGGTGGSGTVTTGTGYTIVGQSGGTGHKGSGAGGNGDAAGNGGGSFFGGGGCGGSGSTTGSTPGKGGGAGSTLNGGTSVAGGDGFVIVYEFA